MSSKEEKIKSLSKKIIKNMKIAGLIDVIVGAFTIITCIFFPALRGFFILGVISTGLGSYYLYKNRKEQENAWNHLDIMVILLIINFFFGVFIPSIFIGLAMYNRHQINVLTNKAY